MARISPFILLPPVLFAAIAGLFLGGMLTDDGDDRPSVFVGKPAPAITDVALDGYPGVDPALLTNGEVTLVNFWASWCAPCRVEHPTLTRLAEEGIPIVGVNFGDDPDNARAFLSEHGNPVASVPFDPGKRTAIDWGVTAPPETFIVAGDGTVLFRYAGPLIGSDYEQRFKPALEAALSR